MRGFLILVFCFVVIFSKAQDWEIPKVEKYGWDIPFTTETNKKKRNILIISQTSSYSLTLLSLNQLWYSDYPRSSFHFINDNSEWLQMDKLGHITASYYIGVAGIQAYSWTGMNRKKAIWYGGLSGFIFLSAVEVLDGFSKQWGASTGDLISNTIGAATAISQKLFWNEQRIQFKYSYRSSQWAKQNPSLLGGNHLERSLKDYNGQTYWLSFNLKSIFQIENTKFPSWLSVAIGHGANGMTRAYEIDETTYRQRQFLLSLDVDLNKIKTNSKLINSILHTFGFLKFPMPTIELRNGKLFMHPMYY